MENEVDEGQRKGVEGVQRGGRRITLKQERRKFVGVVESVSGPNPTKIVFKWGGTE